MEFTAIIVTDYYEHDGKETCKTNTAFFILHYPLSVNFLNYNIVNREKVSETSNTKCYNSIGYFAFFLCKFLVGRVY